MSQDLSTKGVKGFRTSGPGWLLSAYTLGSGTAVGSLWAGAVYGFDLLWGQPFAMLFGIIVLSSVAYFTLQSDVSPYERFKRELHPAMAVAWAGASLLASVIWHFAQYGLAYAALRELLNLPDILVSQAAVGISILCLSTALTWGYCLKNGLKFYEALMKLLVWVTIVCLAVVVVASRVSWVQIARSFITPHVPAGSSTIIFGLIGAAVGINMTFLYPYSLRMKGWKKDDTWLAVRDLVLGMFFPFVFATGMMVIASAVTIHSSGIQLDKSRITEMAQVFTSVFGNRLGPVLFNLGILAMPLSTITLHMLTCGFILSEMTGFPIGSRMWRVGTLVPAVGVLGVAFPLKGWLPVAASAICLIFLPVAYLGFLFLFRKEAYRPQAPHIPAKPFIMFLMAGAVLVVTISALLKVIDTLRALFQILLELDRKPEVAHDF